MLVTPAGREVALVVRRSPRARRLRLAVGAGDGRVRLTLPARAALGPALAWAAGQGIWLERALAALPPPVPLGPDSQLPFEGRPVRVRWEPQAGRGVRLEGDLLITGGPAELAGARVLRWLRDEARDRLTTETLAVAGRAGVSVGRVRVGDARTRWGSCSSSGDIAYSWRLVMAPPAVLAATVAHEVAHRLHMDHGPAFHAAVAHLFGRDPTPERVWLRTNGAALQAIGRSG